MSEKYFWPNTIPTCVYRYSSISEFFSAFDSWTNSSFPVCNCMLLNTSFLTKVTCAAVSTTAEIFLPSMYTGTTKVMPDVGPHVNCLIRVACCSGLTPIRVISLCLPCYLIHLILSNIFCLTMILCGRCWPTYLVCGSQEIWCDVLLWYVLPSDNNRSIFPVIIFHIMSCLTTVVAVLWPWRKWPQSPSHSLVIGCVPLVSLPDCLAL